MADSVFFRKIAMNLSSIRPAVLRLFCPPHARFSQYRTSMEELRRLNDLFATKEIGLGKPSRQELKNAVMQAKEEAATKYIMIFEKALLNNLDGVGKPDKKKGEEMLDMATREVLRSEKLLEPALGSSIIFVRMKYILSEINTLRNVENTLLYKEFILSCALNFYTEINEPVPYPKKELWDLWMLRTKFSECAIKFDPINRYFYKQWNKTNEVLEKSLRNRVLLNRKKNTPPSNNT